MISGHGNISLPSRTFYLSGPLIQSGSESVRIRSACVSIATSKISIQSATIRSSKYITHNCRPSQRKCLFIGWMTCDPLVRLQIRVDHFIIRMRIKMSWLKAIEIRSTILLSAVWIRITSGIMSSTVANPFRRRRGFKRALFYDILWKRVPVNLHAHRP